MLSVTGIPGVMRTYASIPFGNRNDKDRHTESSQGIPSIMQAFIKDDAYDELNRDIETVMQTEGSLSVRQMQHFAHKAAQIALEGNPDSLIQQTANAVIAFCM